MDVKIVIGSHRWVLYNFDTIFLKKSLKSYVQFLTKDTLKSFKRSFFYCSKNFKQWNNHKHLNEMFDFSISRWTVKMICWSFTWFAFQRCLNHSYKKKSLRFSRAINDLSCNINVCVWHQMCEKQWTIKMQNSNTFILSPLHNLWFCTYKATFTSTQ